MTIETARDQVEPETDRDPDPPYLEPELFPVVMVYLTIKLDQGRGWTVAAAVQDQTGKNTIRRWGRSGGSIAHGATKCADDLAEAYQLATDALGPF